MTCRRCPHHVRHGYAGKEGKIEFNELCGLKVKKLEREELEKAAAKKTTSAEKKATPPLAVRTIRQYTESQACEKYPFSASFEYMQCDVYFATFRTASSKNDVIPTKDFQYSDAFNSVSITDMEFL